MSGVQKIVWPKDKEVRVQYANLYEGSMCLICEQIIKTERNQKNMIIHIGATHKWKRVETYSEEDQKGFCGSD